MTVKMTKTAVCAFVMTGVMGLSGCSGSVSEQPEKLPDSFSVRADITDGDFKAAADMKRSADGWLMTVTAPENVKGMQFLLSEGGWTVSCDELSYSAGEDQLPAASPLRITARALDGCTKDKHSGKLAGQQYEVEYKDGKPAVLTTESGLKVSFSKYKKTAHS